MVSPFCLSLLFAFRMFCCAAARAAWQCPEAVRGSAKPSSQTQPQTHGPGVSQSGCEHRGVCFFTGLISWSFALEHR